MSPGHRLLSARRIVACARLGDYARAWERVRAAGAAAGVHAWRFRGASPPDAGAYLEFLEWAAAAADPTTGPELARALAELGAAFPGTVERWEEVPPPHSSEEGPP